MTQKVMSRGETLRYKRYQELEARARADHHEIMRKTASFWAALYEIYADDLWDTAFEKRDDWIASLAAEPHGPSPAQFYSVMRFITTSLQHGMDLSQALFAVATNKTAILYDIPAQWFRRIGRQNYELLPEIAESLKAEGVSYSDKVLEIAAQSAADARKSVADRKGRRVVSCIEREWADNILLVRLAETGGGERAVFHDIQIVVERRTETLDSYLERRFNPIGGE